MLLEQINRSVFIILAYCVGTLMICLGALFLLGAGALDRLPSQQRIIFGIIIAVYGVYRIVSTFIKQKHARTIPS